MGERLRRRRSGEADKAAAEKDKAGGAVPILAGALQTQGARRAADATAFPVWPVAVGAALVVSLGVVAATLASKEGKR